MSTKIFIHRPRKIPPVRPCPVVIEDPGTHQRRVEAERLERDRLEAARRARQTWRRQSRLRHESDLDDIEQLAVAAFPWSKLDLQLAVIAAAGGYSLERPHIGIGAWWAANIIFGFAATQQFSTGLPPKALTVLRETCPFSIDLSSIDPIVELLARAWAINSGPDFNVETFRAGARATARDRTEHRRAALQSVRDAGVILHDLGDGWFALNPQFDRDVAIVGRGKVLSTLQRRNPQAARNSRLAANLKARRR